MDYIIKNATLVNEGESFVASVFVSDGKIAKIIREEEMSDPIIEELLKVVGAVEIDAEGKYLLPGIIDEHVHFREPGLTQKGDIFTDRREGTSKMSKGIFREAIFGVINLRWRGLTGQIKPRTK